MSVIFQGETKNQRRAAEPVTVYHLTTARRAQGALVTQRGVELVTSRVGQRHIG